MVDGYLNILKPPGMTSHDVVGRVRRITGQKRVGHTGTLDPSAIGVLPIALGRATRTVASEAWDTKLYWADVSLGFATDTDDAEGQIIAARPSDHVDLDGIQHELRRFVGSVEQRPPAYSAIHVDGRRAYHAARAGAPSEIASRIVEIQAIEVGRWAPPVVSLRVQCGSGTYMRALARDLGEALGSAAHLSALVRLRVGPFTLRHAITLERLEQRAAESRWREAVWSPDIARLAAPCIVGVESRSLDFGYGRRWRVSASHELHAHDGAVHRLYTPSGALLGFAHQTDDGFWQPALGFVDAASGDGEALQEVG